MKASDIPAVDKLLAREFRAHSAPIIELIQAHTRDPFCVLVGTILSARTKDQCTAGAVRRLFAKAACPSRPFAPSDLDRLSVAAIEKLVYPVGFYHEKARHLKALPSALREHFPEGLSAAGNGLTKLSDFNALVDRLCNLPGVGRKTANLVVAVGFDLPAVCVDIHVHRISNRLGLVRTKTPLETEMALRETLPVRYWKTWNSHLVSFGQTRCSPRNPKCEGCPIAKFCPACGKESRK